MSSPVKIISREKISKDSLKRIITLEVIDAGFALLKTKENIQFWLTRPMLFFNYLVLFLF